MVQDLCSLVGSTVFPILKAPGYSISSLFCLFWSAICYLDNYFSCCRVSYRKRAFCFLPSTSEKCQVRHTTRALHLLHPFLDRGCDTFDKIDKCRHITHEKTLFDIRWTCFSLPVYPDGGLASLL